MAALVSVVIPVHNTGATLPETLASVAKQSLPSELVEVLVINDCSTDADTLRQLDELKVDGIGSFPTRVIRTEQNLGLAGVRNFGHEISQGKYICFLDSDDMIAPDYLEKLFLVLEANPHAGFAYPSVIHVGTRRGFVWAPPFSAERLYRENFLVCSSLIRKSAYVAQRTTKIADGIESLEDWDAWIRMVANGWTGIPVPDTEFTYRHAVKSMLTRSSQAMAATNFVVHRNNLREYAKIRLGRNSNEELPIDHPPAVARIPQAIPPRANKMLQRLTGFSLPNVPLKRIVQAVTDPTEYKKALLSNEFTPKRAEAQAGLKATLNVDALVSWGEKFLSQIDCLEMKDTFMFCHPWWDVGGAEVILLDWIRALRERNPGVEFVEVVGMAWEATEAMRPDFAEYVDMQVVLDRLDSNADRRLLALLALVLLRQPKLIFIMSSAPAYVLLPVIKRLLPDVKVVDLLHCEDNDDPAWFGSGVDYQAQLDLQIVTSEYWREVLIRKYGQSPDRIAVANNAVDTSKFSVDRFDNADLRERFGIEKGKRIVMFLGRLAYQKNPLAFVRLAENAISDDRFIFLCVGSGPMKDDVEKAAVGLGNFLMLGSTRNPEQMMALADVLVFPSVYEGYPMVGIEAAAMGKPVIASDTAGFNEQLTTGQFGVLINMVEPRRDGRALWATLSSQYENLIKLGQNGPEFVRQHHLLDVCSDRYGEVIRQALTSGTK